MQSGTVVEDNIKLSMGLLEKAMRDSPDLVIFPEYQMLLPDYSNIDGTKSLFETEAGSFVSSFRDFSSDNAISIMINIAELRNSKHYNTSVAIENGDVKAKYSKTHLFDAYSFRESSVYDPGDAIPEPFELYGVSIAPMICYDIRFPELARIYEERGADLLVYQAGWYSGQNKLDLWISMLRSRATECGCFSTGIAQCGSDFTGHTTAFSPYGNALGELENSSGHLTFEINAETLESYRKDVPLRKQRRADLYRLTY